VQRFTVRNYEEMCLPKLSPEQRAEIQMGLNKLGFNLESDGEFGPRTREAITRFQQQYGQQPSGFLTGDDRFRVAAAATNNPYFPPNAYREGSQGAVQPPAAPILPFNPRSSSSPTVIRTPLQPAGGTFTVPVLINNRLTLDFVLDSGAADVSIPADVVLTLMRTGTLSEADFLGSQTYRLADGRTIPSVTFRIKSLEIGDIIIENVTGSVAPIEGHLLLGQSFLRGFKSWSIDNQRQVLVLEPLSALPEEPQVAQPVPSEGWLELQVA
jgi:gag-polyprotein putative aspartyl protease/Putative peptidoglycan binding domain